MNKNWPILVGLLFILTCAEAKTLLVVGDSISTGYGLKNKKTWVNYLEEKLKKIDPNWTVINSSIPGDTVASAQQRFNPLLKKWQPDYVILELGGNDGLRGLSIPNMYQKFSIMITDSLTHNAKVMVFVIPIPTNYGPLYRQKHQAVYLELAKKFPITLVPKIFEIIAEQPDLMQVDGIHPNANGQKQFFTLLWPHLKRWLLSQNQ